MSLSGKPGFRFNAGFRCVPDIFFLCQFEICLAEHPGNQAVRHSFSFMAGDFHRLLMMQQAVKQCGDYQ